VRAIVALAALDRAPCVSPDLALAQQASSGGPSRAEALTQALVNMNPRYPTAAPAERSRLRSSLVTIAATRQQLLASLMENDPAPGHRRSVSA
jgi:hypothetical protein